VTEYRIVAKIDPSGATAGRAKVRQELEGMAADAQRAGKAGAAGLDTMTAAEFRAAGGVEGLTNKVKQQGNEFKNLATALKGAIQAQKDAEAAARRVEDAVDHEAAAQRRLNQLLKDAKLAHDAGRLSAENYAKVQKLAADGQEQIAKTSGRARAGLTQLSFQVGDISQGLALGTRASTIFAQQSGQVIQSLQVMGGEGNKFLRFIGGPWGIALSTAAVVLGPFVGKLLEGNDALADGVEKLKKDAAETEADRKAKELYMHTEEGLVAAVRDRLAVMDEAIKKSRTQGEQDNILAQQTMIATRATRDQTKALLEQALAQERITKIRSQAPGERGEIASLGLEQAGSRARYFQDQLTANQAAVDDAEKLFQKSLVELADERSQRDSADPAAKIKERYEGPNGIITLKKRELELDKTLTTDQNARARAVEELTRLRKVELGLIKEAEKAERDRNKVVSDGVERFRTAKQAIGVAGKELQSAGLRVSENEQFGGVTPGVHTGAGHRNGTAIDVNSGAGVVEANVPDIKARFDVLAQRYAARGYIVLWNGKRYDPSGKVTPIPPGQDQHHDHMHVEAPGTIVGKATNSSTAAQEFRDDKAAATAAEQKRDFVSGVINAANAKAQPNRAEALQANIQKTFADYQTRFNETMSKTDKEAVTKALTDADARAVADHFKQAYVDPLKLLEDQLGKTAIERAILSDKEKEAADLGRPLTAIENAEIEARHRRGDLLTREGQILTDLKQPLEDYRNNIKALVDLLDKGQISQAGFNARVSELNAPVRQVLANAPDGFKQQGGFTANDGFGQSSKFGDVGDFSKAQEENARYAAELDSYEKYRQQLQEMGINYDALEEAAKARHIQNLNDIDMQRRQTQLSAAQSIADSLASIAEAGLGKQSAAYRVLFNISKAFTIAQASLALYQNVSQAMAKGFPQNIPLIAQAFAQGAIIIGAIKSMTSPGFQSGGYTGDAGRSTPAGVVHGQEFVMNAEATARHRPLLEALNTGRSNARPAAANDMGHGGRAVNLKIVNNAPGVEFDVRPGPSHDDVEVIARKVVRSEAPGVVASDMRRSNSPTAKALTGTYGVPRRKN
jgi:hypothetical protein